uniref:(northern house mosquito) hypothetical protein n=1 Tax=Culex pipiens TaxID=7175 RepID=A0A8D8C5N7_CULPI
MLSIANIVRQPRLLSHSETHTVIELSLTLTNCIRSENGLSTLCLSHDCTQMVAVTTQQNAEQKMSCPVMKAVSNFVQSQSVTVPFPSLACNTLICLWTSLVLLSISSPRFFLGVENVGFEVFGVAKDDFPVGGVGVFPVGDFDWVQQNIE